MKLHFTITTDDASVAPVVVESAKKVISCGRAADAVIRLPELPEKAAEIRFGESISVFRLDDDLPLTINDETVKGDAELRNGSVVSMGPYRILVSVQFERASYNVRSGLAVMATLFLIIAIIITEGLIVTWLPTKISQSELFGGEELRQKTLYQMDIVRNNLILGNLKKDRHDSIVRQTLGLYKVEADRMALYLRTHHNQMTLDQLKLFKNDLRIMEKQVRQLINGKLIPPQRKLNFRPRLHEEIKEKEVER